MSWVVLSILNVSIINLIRQNQSICGGRCFAKLSAHEALILKRRKYSPALQALCNLQPKRRDVEPSTWQDWRALGETPECQLNVQSTGRRKQETLPTVKHLVYSGVPSWSLLTRFFFSLVHADSKEGGHKSCLYLWRALGSCSGMQTDSLMSCILGTTTASCQGL